MAKKAAQRTVVKKTPTRRTRAAAPVTLKDRTFDARSDLADFRDRMYEPTLIEVSQEIPLAGYLRVKVPILDQGQEGACTGFALATVAHYLLRRRSVRPDLKTVSPRMFYDMARRYDEFDGDETEGSSARGAMKGWHKHGVCSEKAWPYVVGAPPESLTGARALDASQRPLGAYLRVNHQDLTAMHCAISEVGVLYATGLVHSGWNSVDSTSGLIEFNGQQEILGGHAFALVAYDREGFWLQNSWGPKWGRRGFAKIKYSDWLIHGTDVWVARLGVPISLDEGRATAAVNADIASTSTSPAFHRIRPHIISIGNNGSLQTRGTYATTEEDVRQIINIEAKATLAAWSAPKLLIYAHGGLTPETSAIQRVADYAEPLLSRQIYPLMFSWNSDYWTTVRNILEDSLRSRSSGGVIDATKNFLLDRLDDALEPIARQLSGMAAWSEMKQNSIMATTSAAGGARKAMEAIAKLKSELPKLEVHVAGHSAGGIFDAYLLQYLCTEGKIADGPLQGVVGLGVKVASCTLWAPACTTDLFVKTYGVCLRAGRIGQLRLFTLTEGAEQDDDVANIYHKSLLYLVSHAFEDVPRIPLVRKHGVPIAGMAQSFELAPEQFSQPRDQAAVKELQKLRADQLVEWIQAPNSVDPYTTAAGSTALHHGDFDDDVATLTSLAAAIGGLGHVSTTKAAAVKLVGDKSAAQLEGMAPKFPRSARSCNQRREQLERAL